MRLIKKHTQNNPFIMKSSNSRVDVMPMMEMLKGGK